MTELDADLVVVGGGGAGLPAAITALEAGVARVVLVEKRKNIGGNAAMSGGFLFAVGSRPQREAGVDGDGDAVFRETMAYHHYEGVDPRLMRAFVDAAPATVAWLEDHGVPYRSMAGNERGVEPAGWLNHPGSFRRAMNMLRETFEERGGTVLSGTAVRAVDRGPDGRVQGISAESADSESLAIRAGQVILATGGFTGNTTLLERHFGAIYDDDVYWTDSKRHSGDGIELAAGSGAAVDGPSQLIKESCYSFTTKRNMPERAATEPASIWVNRRGERFADESLGMVNASTNALVAQPGMVGFALFDDDLIQHVMDQPDPFAENPERDGEDQPNAWTPEGYRRTLRETLADPDNRDWSIAAGSWDEVAAWIEADPEVLRSTVDAYNDGCESGRDALLAKDPSHLRPLRTPPFYALKFRPLMIDTAGPVVVNERMEVLDERARPIPGLLAAGALVSGWIGRDEHLFGTPLSWSISSGRIAGAQAALQLGEVLHSSGRDG